MGMLEQIKTMKDYEVGHLDGIAWHEAVLPFRFHKCKVQTSGWLDSHLVDRCACGSLRVDQGHWNFKNERRRRVPSF